MARRKGKRKRRRASTSSAPRRRSRGRKRKSRGATLGIIGKIGLAFGIGAPVGYSGLEAAERVGVAMKGSAQEPAVGIIGAAKVGFWQFANTLNYGFTGANLVEQIRVYDAKGTPRFYNVQSNAPAGAWKATAIVGATLVAWDVLSSWATRKLAKVRSAPRLGGMKLVSGK